MLPQSYEEDIKQISQGSSKQNNSLGEFSKTWKGWPNFFKFRSISIRYNRRQETVSMKK